MRWGVLFGREINLTYARIQDIHLSSNVVKRCWLGLARIEIQTASGSAKAEMTIEGISAYEELRDFLYSRMRGIGFGSAGPGRRSGTAGAPGAPGALAPAATPAAGSDELAAVLREVASELRAVRREIEDRGAGEGPGRG